LQVHDGAGGADLHGNAAASLDVMGRTHSRQRGKGQCHSLMSLVTGCRW
jgi:hypothetical protein